jgi:hypothetical protein
MPGFICENCQSDDHTHCPGGTWCACQHKPRRRVEPETETAQ